jgi:hypothetical protein
MHLTNFTLNKQNENYKACDYKEEGEDKGSKRLLSTVWRTLEEEGYDVESM